MRKLSLYCVNCLPILGNMLYTLCCNVIVVPEKGGRRVYEKSGCDCGGRPCRGGYSQISFARYAPDAGEEFDIRWFQSGGAFLDEYQPIYDLVMMDIDLPGISGMATAERLRRVDRAVTLVFVTNLARYAAKGYAVDAMDFLLKPVSYPSFIGALQRALMRCRQNRHPDLLINIPDGVYCISTDRVKYIEVINHTLVYHTTEGAVRASGNLKDIEGRLPPGSSSAATAVTWSTWPLCGLCGAIGWCWIWTSSRSAAPSGPQCWKR